MLLLVTFVFLTLNIPVRSLVFYLNFSSRNTPYYYAGFELLFEIGEKAEKDLEFPMRTQQYHPLKTKLIFPF